MFGSSTRIVCLLITAAALTGCGAPSEISRSATVLQIPQAESLSVVARQFQNDVPYTINFGLTKTGLTQKRQLALTHKPLGSSTTQR